MEIKKEHRCYVCNRTEKEFFSSLDPATYDKAIMDLKAEIKRLYIELIADIKSILEMIEDCDPALTISELTVQRKAASKLLHTYVNESASSCSFENVKIYQIKDTLLEAIKQLEKRVFPKSIKVDKSILKKEEKLRALTQKKEALEYLITHPHFKGYETIIREVGKIGIPVKYKLCPICSDLRARYLQSIQEDEEWEWIC